MSIPLGVEHRLVQIRNEMYAQKAYSKLNYGALSNAINTPTANWSGWVNNNESVIDSVAASFIVRFTRTDGVKIPPLVDFAYDFVQSKYAVQDMLDTPTEQGRISAIEIVDRYALDEFYYSGKIIESGENYVNFRIDISSLFHIISQNGANISITVEAISPVEGVITIERVE